MKREEVLFREKKAIVFRGNYGLPKDAVVELKVKIPDGQGGYSEETLISEPLSSDGRLIVRGLSIVEDITETGGWLWEEYVV